MIDKPEDNKCEECHENEDIQFSTAFGTFTWICKECDKARNKKYEGAGISG